MTITPDHAAASADLSDQGGLIVLNFTELINIDLSNIKSAIMLEIFISIFISSSNINIICDHINNNFIIRNLGKGISYDIKIIIDGVERIVKNVTTTGTKVSPISLNNAHR